MLIIEFAQSLLNKMGTEDKQRHKDKDSIRMKPRMMEWLLKHLHSGKPQNLELSDFLSGQGLISICTSRYVVHFQILICSSIFMQ